MSLKQFERNNAAFNQQMPLYNGSDSSHLIKKKLKRKLIGNRFRIAGYVVMFNLFFKKYVKSFTLNTFNYHYYFNPFQWLSPQNYYKTYSSLRYLIPSFKNKQKFFLLGPTSPFVHTDTQRQIIINKSNYLHKNLNRKWIQPFTVILGFKSILTTFNIMFENSRKG